MLKGATAAGAVAGGGAGGGGGGSGGGDGADGGMVESSVLSGPAQRGIRQILGYAGVISDDDIRSLCDTVCRRLVPTPGTREAAVDLILTWEEDPSTALR